MNILDALFITGPARPALRDFAFNVGQPVSVAHEGRLVPGHVIGRAHASGIPVYRVQTVHGVLQQPEGRLTRRAARPTLAIAGRG